MSIGKVGLTKWGTDLFTNVGAFYNWKDGAGNPKKSDSLVSLS